MSGQAKQQAQPAAKAEAAKQDKGKPFEPHEVTAARLQVSLLDSLEALVKRLERGMSLHGSREAADVREKIGEVRTHLQEAWLKDEDKEAEADG